MVTLKPVVALAALMVSATMLLACGDDDDDEDDEDLLATAKATETLCPTATGAAPEATADPEADDDGDDDDDNGDDDDDDDNSGSGGDDDDDDDNGGSGSQLPGDRRVPGPALLTTGSPSPTATSTAGADPCPPGVEEPEADPQATVDIVDFAFEPGDVDIEVGQTIGWTNSGDATHTVTADDEDFDSGDLDTGGEFTFTFVTAGEFAYHCDRHPEMTGVIRVE